jgi:hypothetical protein
MICIWRLGQGASCARVDETPIKAPIPTKKPIAQRLLMVSTLSLENFEKGYDRHSRPAMNNFSGGYEF